MPTSLSFTFQTFVLPTSLPVVDMPLRSMFPARSFHRAYLLIRLTHLHTNQKRHIRKKRFLYVLFLMCPRGNMVCQHTIVLHTLYLTGMNLRLGIVIDSYQQNLATIPLQYRRVISLFDLSDSAFRCLIPFQFHDQCGK